MPLDAKPAWQGDTKALLPRRVMSLRRWGDNMRCYLDFFFSCLAVFFSFIVFAGFFLSLFFESRPLLMLVSLVWFGGKSGNKKRDTGKV